MHAGLRRRNAEEYPSFTQTHAFLASDIEGSTALLRRLGGPEYGRVLGEHHRIVRRELAEGGGRELANEGDGFFAAFSSPSACVGAAAAIQRAMARTVWPEAAEVRVRIGIHVGEADEHEEAGLVGLALHRTARVGALGHGGQVLLSEAAAVLVRESLPGGLALRELGAYELAGLDGAERIFQLEGEGLGWEFPPLRVERVPAAAAKSAAALTVPATTAGTPDGREGARAALRVVIAEDSALLREGLRRLLADAGFEVVGVATDADSLLALVDEHQPDVVVSDIRMPPTNTTEGLEAAKVIRAKHAGTAVLLMSHHIETDQVVELLEDDPRGLGYVLKDRIADVEQFGGLLRRLAGGESAIDPEVVTRLVRRSQVRRPVDELSERERDVLTLMAEGRSNLAIATQLHLSAKTVETHVGAIFTKLGLLPAEEDHRRVLAVLAYLRS